MDKARPPPKSTYEGPKDPIELEKIREENHRQGLHKLHQAQSLNYHVLQTERSNKSVNLPIKPTEENLGFRANPAPAKEQVHSLLFVFSDLRSFISDQQNPGEIKYRDGIERKSIVQKTRG